MLNQYVILLLMLLVVPIGGELKFYPFAEDFSTFRVSFGSPFFLFFLLWLRGLPFALSGVLAGAAVLAARLGLDLWNGSELFLSFAQHFSAFFYYVTYALCFQLSNARRFFHQPLRIGALAIAAEIIASLVQLLFSLPYQAPAASVTSDMLGKILLIAIIRNFFILSFFVIISLRQTELAAEQKQQQHRQLQLIIAALYKEMVQLEKSMQHAETITRNCYALSTRTDVLSCAETSTQLLSIAGEVHEIKKDSQRIYASLQQLIQDGRLREYLAPAELADIILHSQAGYARSLQKNIVFHRHIDSSLPPLHVSTLLSVVNNLAANAVEAITAAGQITLVMTGCTTGLELRVMNDGPRIDRKKYDLIFRPGYTTKFDNTGRSSTGMGLPYVRDLVATRQGTITLTEDARGHTVFTIQLPLSGIIQEV